MILAALDVHELGKSRWRRRGKQEEQGHRDGAATTDTESSRLPTCTCDYLAHRNPAAEASPMLFGAPFWSMA